MSKTQPGSKRVHGKPQCLLSPKSSQNFAFRSGLLVLIALIKLTIKILCSPGFFFRLSVSSWSYSHDTCWLQLGRSFFEKETSQEYWNESLSSQKETAQWTEALRSAASDAVLNGFCFQDTGKNRKDFYLLSKAVVSPGAELSEIAPNAWKGRVCSKSPSFGRIPGLLCRAFIDFLRSICPSSHQMHMTSPADGRSPARQLEWHTQVMYVFMAAKKSSSWANIMSTRHSWADMKWCVDVNFQPIVKCQDTIVWQALCPLCVQNGVLMPLCSEGPWMLQEAFLVAFR